MTRQKTLKRQVRSRMAKTGERYTSARRQLVDRATRKADAANPRPSRAAAPAVVEMPTSDEAMRANTGRGYQDWFAVLDAWGATGLNHTQITRWLVAEHGVDGWWSQAVTVGYERARGMRAKYQRVGGVGFSVTATRTVNVPLEQLADAFTNARTRSRWLPDVVLRRRPNRAADTARFDVEGGTSRLTVWFVDRGGTKSVASLEHERLPDSEVAERMRTFWRERLGDLKRLLEA
jgi:uncharacterized protein YndB with AHSA1/START domain